MIKEFDKYKISWINAVMSNDMKNVKLVLDKYPELINAELFYDANALLHSISERFYDMFSFLINHSNINLLYKSSYSNFDFIDMARICNYNLLLPYEIQKIIFTKEPSLIKSFIRFYKLHPSIENEFQHLKTHEIGLL